MNCIITSKSPHSLNVVDKTLAAILIPIMHAVDNADESLSEAVNKYNSSDICYKKRIAYNAVCKIIIVGGETGTVKCIISRPTVDTIQMYILGVSHDAAGELLAAANEYILMGDPKADAHSAFLRLSL